ncbi:hypothetical protein ICM_06283 [Bacillus cereus BAG1X2-3]|uniref:Uncharacterized protein n=1 Tax=Bacillus cereus TaxID=1396 RepID=A0A9X7HPA1_BACCE|nr:hypothetical protein [Bacillus cereus]EOO23060.1 hypothetical protein ICC_06430 [Bacillus cereus BAG1X1-1]EOO42840.1 hypothetical protein ICI_06347 [Bacillus cereus BAG1X2-1]EOO43950.1 hypothetical protein ICK_06643 [Bacillus cereus BAG1X2-2]EOO55982.1 hypothetical protein ICM_06283 [Bacillus cereus BAG1X2-3]EOO99922.1 hypothetical protein ICO_06694 [Bacillus cereus BAG2O-1]
MDKFVGHLVANLGLDHKTSLTIVTMLGTAGAAAVSAAWPVLAPFVLTLRGIVAVAGTTAAVGW